MEFGEEIILMLSEKELRGWCVGLESGTIAESINVAPSAESLTFSVKQIINDDWEHQEMKKIKKENSYFQNTGKYKRGKR